MSGSVVYSISVPRGSKVDHMIQTWKDEKLNISARVCYLLDPDTTMRLESHSKNLRSLLDELHMTMPIPDWNRLHEMGFIRYSWNVYSKKKAADPHSGRPV